MEPESVVNRLKPIMKSSGVAAPDDTVRTVFVKIDSESDIAADIVAPTLLYMAYLP